MVGDQIDPGPYGIGVRKDDGDLQSVLQEALRAIIEDGSYDRVLTQVERHRRRPQERQADRRRLAPRPRPRVA